MKKLINSPDTVITDALRGMSAAHPGLTVDVENRVISRAQRASDKVGLVSGGGSGHEPLHGGYVGHGMLDAAVPGEIYTSPVPDQIIAATKAANADRGVLHIVKNYTGDVLNFQMAAELAEDEGIDVVSVIMNDDVAVEDSTHTAGRRGTGATIVAEKVAGAAAEEGADLETVARIATEVNERSRSFGIALHAGTVPSAGRPGFELADDEVELGVGIHGEPGRERGTFGPARDLVSYALDAIHADLSISDEVLLILNGQGATPLIELYGAFAEASAWLGGHGAAMVRSLVGNYITSLDQAGFSITVTSLTDELRRLWDAPVSTPALRWGV
ncbi:dihydroxyacetone kinase subunit DhaK [Actinobacteria bacterium YIM 96077]|uniref:Dihydroxyacetone kinase subunit DhaK n=1 Tax=Phytoactinopolyspora halophila TaxID=1981511 RepID=A0A329R3L9_9ACTN|nr:dihydroxyacetone kinase subunit DhaK [Phytoactinopolyspora halophila]AYY12136.1 dihydroxyacetone kinase subunit DhaK [Actinobacteria bacterium YIM 96077]RAW18629.1 dihydroxyacetone kinase subunit DhaK [Phytoactinopolyspora halophila]